MSDEVEAAVNRFLAWNGILYGTGCMGGWGSRCPEFEKDIQAGIVLANYIQKIPTKGGAE